MKKYCIFGVLTVVLVFCLVFAACKNDPPPSPTKFEGEWYNTDPTNPAIRSFFRFTDDSFEHRYLSSTVRGTFIFTATTIIFSYSSGKTLECQYTLDNDRKDLKIEPGNADIAEGTYGRRRAAESDEDFEGTWKCLYAEADEVGYTDFSYVFTGNNFNFKTTHPNGGEFNVNRLGTFISSNTGIDFSPQPLGAWIGYKATYHFEGSKILWINASPAQHPEMLFVKQ